MGIWYGNKEGVCGEIGILMGGVMEVREIRDINAMNTEEIAYFLCHILHCQALD